MVRIGTTYVSPAVEAPTVHNVEVCASQDSPVGEGETQAFSCGKMGRYLVVLLEKIDGILTLCEVEVFAKGSHSRVDIVTMVLWYIRACIILSF